VCRLQSSLGGPPSGELAGWVVAAIIVVEIAAGMHFG